MIHILICPHTLDYGGSQIGVYHWARHLDPEKFTVSMLAMRKGGLSERFEESFPVYYDDMGYPGIEEHIRRIKPDIVHCCPGGGEDQEYITRAATLAPVVTQTVMCPRQVGNYEDVAGSVVISNFVLGLQKRRENVIYIDLPFDAGAYDARFDRAHFGLPEGKLLVGSLGNSRKENDHFVKIARRYKGEGVHFVIKTGDRFRSLFGRKKVTVINRWLTEDEKLSLMDCFDIFMYPTSNEAYGLVFLEAMSRRVPVITYDDSANAEVVDGGGVFAPLGDMDAMEAHLDRLLNDAGERKRLGEHGAALVAERNDPKRIAEQYEEFFLSALERQRRG